MAIGPYPQETMGFTDPTPAVEIPVAVLSGLVGVPNNCHIIVVLVPVIVIA